MRGFQGFSRGDSAVWPRPEDHRAVWRLAWPMILSNLSVPLLGLVDTAILGHLPDARYLAAVAVGSTLFGFLYWGFGFLRMGTTGLVAQALGREEGGRDEGALRLLLAQGLVLGVVLGSAVLLASPLLIPVGLGLIEPPPQVLDEALRYTGIRIWSAPAVLATYALLGFLVGMQDTRRVLIVTVVTNGVNIILDLVLVVGLDMRTEGVAAATLVAEVLGLVVAATLAWQRLRDHPGVLERAALLRASAYRRLLAVNGHLFVRTLCLLGTLAFFTAQGARQGEVVLAANALLLNLLMLVSHGLDGFAHATEALTGRAIGARDRIALARRLLASAAFSLGTALAFCVIFVVGGSTIVGLLTDLDGVADTAARYLPWLAVLPLVAVWCFLLDGLFIGATRTRAMRDTMLLATFGVFVPLWWLTRALGNDGLWLAFDAFFLARGLALGAVALRAFAPGGDALLRPDD